MAGMLAHCDFDEQVSTLTDDGRLRPDMIVHVPGGGEIVVDAKVPLEAFLKLIDADDDYPVRCSEPRMPGSSGPTSTSGQEGVLEAIRPVTAAGGGVHPGRSAALGGLRVRPHPAGARHGQRRAADHADHAHRAPPHRRLRMAPGVAGRERPRGAAPGGRNVRAAADDERAHAAAPAQPDGQRVGVQRCRGIPRIPRPRLGPPLSGPRRGGRGGRGYRRSGARGRLSPAAPGDRVGGRGGRGVRDAAPEGRGATGGQHPRAS